MACILLRRRISIALHLIGAFFQNFWDIDQEQRAGSDSRENVCYRFSVVNADDAEKPRQNNGKRNQQITLRRSARNREIFACPSPIKAD